MWYHHLRGAFLYTPDKEADMGVHNKVVQSVAEKLMEDERLRTNLADDEAKLLIDWALAWVEGRVFKAPNEATARQLAQAELVRLRPAMSKINDILDGGKTPALTDAVQALGLPATKTATNPLDRKGLIRALTTQLAELWRKQ
jgi:hypothetical protein